MKLNLVTAIASLGHPCSFSPIPGAQRDTRRTKDITADEYNADARAPWLCLFIAFEIQQSKSAVFSRFYPRRTQFSATLWGGIRDTCEKAVLCHFAYILCQRGYMLSYLLWNNSNGLFSSSRRAFVHPRLDGYTEEMANSTRRRPGNPAHGHRRAWHENSESGAKSRS